MFNRKAKRIKALQTELDATRAENARLRELATSSGEELYEALDTIDKLHADLSEALREADGWSKYAELYKQLHSNALWQLEQLSD